MPNYIDYANMFVEEIMEAKDVENEKMKEKIKAQSKGQRLMRYKKD